MHHDPDLNLVAATCALFASAVDVIVRMDEYLKYPYKYLSMCRKWSPKTHKHAITILIVGGDEIYIITVDARQGYHQVAVRKLDQEKLAFFAPDGKKYTWKVMPFGPMNAPAFYTAMMGAFKVEWDKLFIQELTKNNFSEKKFVRPIRHSPNTVQDRNIYRVNSYHPTNGNLVIALK